MMFGNYSRHNPNCTSSKNVRTIKKILSALLAIPALLLLSGCNLVVMNPSGDIAIQQRDLIITSTVLMLLIIVVVGITFTAACMATGVGPQGTPRRELPRRLAHSIVPIIVGYMIAHYLSFLVEYGQQTLILISDPGGTGANLFGTADLEINYWLSQNPSVVASIKVLAIVTGHVLGVIAAHDRSLTLLARRHLIMGQLALLFAMVGYTFMGLYLLFGA